MPRLPPAYAIWMGHIATKEELRARYAVDEVRRFLGVVRAGLWLPMGSGLCRVAQKLAPSICIALPAGAELPEVVQPATPAHGLTVPSSDPPPLPSIQT